MTPAQEAAVAATLKVITAVNIAAGRADARGVPAEVLYNGAAGPEPTGVDVGPGAKREELVGCMKSLYTARCMGLPVPAPWLRQHAPHLLGLNPAEVPGGAARGGKAPGPALPGAEPLRYARELRREAVRALGLAKEQGGPCAVTHEPDRGDPNGMPGWWVGPPPGNPQAGRTVVLTAHPDDCEEGVLVACQDALRAAGVTDPEAFAAVGGRAPSARKPRQNSLFD